VNVNGERLYVTIETAPAGFKATGVQNPSVFGQGRSVTAAKFDFAMAYVRVQKSLEV
jgi:hypothetical protein